MREGNNNPVTFMVTFMTYFSITLDLYVYIYCTWTLAFRSIKPVNLSIFIYIYIYIKNKTFITSQVIFQFLPNLPMFGRKRNITREVISLVYVNIYWKLRYYKRV